MKHTTFLITLGAMLLFIPVHGQKKAQNRPWELNCRNKTTQIELNECYAKSAEIADQFLQQLWQSKLVQFEKQIQDMGGESAASDNEYLRILIEQKTSLKVAMQAFSTYRENMTNYIGYYYEGGSMKSMMMNDLRLSLTVHQIELLESAEE